MPHGRRPATPQSARQRRRRHRHDPRGIRHRARLDWRHELQTDPWPNRHQRCAGCIDIVAHIKARCTADTRAPARYPIQHERRGVDRPGLHKSILRRHGRQDKYRGQLRQTRQADTGRRRRKTCRPRCRAVGTTGKTRHRRCSCLLHGIIRPQIPFRLGRTHRRQA